MAGRPKRGRNRSGDKTPALSRQEQVARLYLQGMTIREIESVVGVTKSTVHRDLEAIRTAWRESAIRDFDDLKSQELARIDERERQAWEAWERSIGTKTKRTRKLEGDGTESLTTATERMAGDPRFLDAVAKCCEQRCKILGLDAPFKVAPTSPDGTSEYQENARRLTEEQLLAIYALRGGTAINGTNGHQSRN